MTAAPARRVHFPRRSKCGRASAARISSAAADFSPFAARAWARCQRMPGLAGLADCCTAQQRQPLGAVTTGRRTGSSHRCRRWRPASGIIAWARAASVTASVAIAFAEASPGEIVEHHRVLVPLLAPDRLISCRSHDPSFPPASKHRRREAGRRRLCGLAMANARAVDERRVEQPRPALRARPGGLRPRVEIDRPGAGIGAGGLAVAAFGS